MKIYLFTIIALFIFSASAFGFEESAVSLYKGNYIQSARSGEQDNSYTQAQFSLKYQPLRHNLDSIFIGFTNTFWWMTSEKSSEVRETNYNVEIFYQKKSAVRLSNNITINSLQLGIDHKSNGKKGAESRGTNSFYVKGGGYFGERIRIGGEVTAFTYVENSVKNRDIQDYTGNFLYKAYASIFSTQYEKNIIQLSYTVQLGNNTNLSRGRQEVLLKANFFPKKINPALFIKYETGYGTQGLTHYNEKHSATIFGLSLQ